jgi:Rrf2 family protein
MSTEFALHGLLYLASRRDSTPIQLPDVAAAIKVRQSYLRKLFQQMVKSGILEAFKGAKGGYRLKRDPAEITFYDVLRTVEGDPGRYHCLARERACELQTDCPINTGFGEAFQLLRDQLKRVTLASILDSRAVAAKPVTWLRRSEIQL